MRPRLGRPPRRLPVQLSIHCWSSGSHTSQRIPKQLDAAKPAVTVEKGMQDGGSITLSPFSQLHGSDLSNPAAVLLFGGCNVPDFVDVSLSFAFAVCSFYLKCLHVRRPTWHWVADLVPKKANLPPNSLVPKMTNVVPKMTLRSDIQHGSLQGVTLVLEMANFKKLVYSPYLNFLF